MRNTFFRGIFFAVLALAMMQPAEGSVMELKQRRKMKAARAKFISDYKEDHDKKPTDEEILAWQQEWKRLRLERKENKRKALRAKKEAAVRAAYENERRLEEEERAARIEQRRLADEELYAKPKLSSQEETEVMREANYLQSHRPRPLGNIEGMRPRARR